MALRDYLDVSTRAELYNFVMQSDQALLVLGVTVAGDIPAEIWYFAAGSMAVDDGTTVIKPTAIPVGNPGRYVRWIQESDWNYTLNKPTIPAAQVNADWASGSGVSQILNKPSLATVATSGSYTDLINQPTIPAAQIQSDWTQVSSGSLDFIKNKPTLKRVETYLGTSDGSGNYTVTYGAAFSTTPDVQPQLQAGTVNQQVRITASSTTGFTVQATQRAVLSILGLDVLAGTSTALASASIGVLVTSR